MKERFSKIIMAIAILATGMASVGCAWWFQDEPDSISLFHD